MGPALSRSLEFLHCNAAARRPSHVFVAFVSRGPMLFTYRPFCRQAAQDRSPWVERSGFLGKNPRGANPERGVGKETHDAGAGAASAHFSPISGNGVLGRSG